MNMFIHLQNVVFCLKKTSRRFGQVKSFMVISFCFGCLIDNQEKVHKTFATHLVHLQEKLTEERARNS